MISNEQTKMMTCSTKQKMKTLKFVNFVKGIDPFS